MPKTDEVKFARWGNGDEPQTGEFLFIADNDHMPTSLQHLHILLGQGGEERADELLAQGAACVLLADAAVLDSAVISRLVERHEGGRIGLYVPAGKMPVSWALETVSNEDFNCLAPSYGKPSWEVLLFDGAGTGTDVEWWLAEMFKRGISIALIGVDMEDDDLNICAGLMESFGENLWFTPLQRAETDMEPWVRYGQVRQLLLPALPEYDSDEERLRIAASCVAIESTVEEA